MIYYETYNYAKIEKDKPNYGHSMRGSMSEVLIPTMYNYGNNYQRKLKSDINIVKEFGLIQNKESKLSKWEREQVVLVFEKNFKRIGNVCEECHKTFDYELLECERCSKMFCDKCQAPYTQLTQIDFCCCVSCSQRNED